MTQKPASLRLAAALLLASSALSPALAQEAQPPAEPAPEATPPPVATEAAPAPAPVEQPAPPAAAPVATSSEPVVNTRASGREPASTEARERSAATRSARTTPQRPIRTAARPAPVRARTVAQPEAAAPPAPETVAPPAPIAETIPAPAPVADTPAPAVETPVAPVEAAEPSPVANNETDASSYLPWLIIPALAIGGLLLLARRRRRVADQDDYVAYEEPTVTAEPAPAAYVDEPAPTPVHREPAAHILPVAAAAAAAPANNGRPWLDLAITPVRAGVGEDAARVEFELGVENNGSAPAQDVRISTWLLNGNGTDMERMLIDRPATPQQLDTSLEPGDGTRIATAVALPRAGIEDAILPVVAAEARYRLPDGSEGRTAASFAVGVARGEKLVMFDVENPSGMHEGVEARLHGEPSRD